ncbi:hypothetical protein VIGAN_02248000 [Vigna angularis var. angularis]|uniref:Response regulatory domain-containing protein n=1 Tax=Vigna angularis var. angularis TaxID=157739 RepID=A0A0S3RG31_PHAAN|nr:hypothetical protein VIGAN_02248000 [Vigna angularis var. angularis]
MAAASDVFRPEVGSGKLHVLAVDDSHVDRKVIERLLKISSCKVTVVESGSRALQYLGLDGEKSSIGFDSVKVNLIMTDYSMPGMTGYELLKKIKESSVFREVPVVVMSSENILTRIDSFVIDSCLEEGAEEFLLKPVKLSDVKRVTDFIMKGEGKKGHKRSRSDDYSPPSSSSSSISTAFSSVSHSCDLSLPASPSALLSKKTRLSI